MMPVQCTGLPIVSCSSQTSTRCPSRARRLAAYRPPGPAPMTSTSTCELDIDALIIRPSSSDLSVAALPTSTAGDPKRQQDQLQIEPEARALPVQAIEAEFVGARDVARRVDLRQPGQPGTHQVPLAIAGNRLERHEVAVAAQFDLAGHQRARADEAHVADH